MWRWLSIACLLPGCLALTEQSSGGDAGVAAHVASGPSKVVTVTGRVKHPGAVPWNHKLTLRDVLVTTELAKPGLVWVGLDRDGSRYLISLAELNEGVVPNRYLAPGDVITCEEIPTTGEYVVIRRGRRIGVPRVSMRSPNKLQDLVLEPGDEIRKSERMFKGGSQ